VTDVSIEPVTGWRLWGLATDPPGTPVLLPAGAGRGIWPARRRFEARCSVDDRVRRARIDAPHESPSLGCTCGIYASASLRDLATSTPSLPALSVVGTVSMWGRTIEHERGWRSRFAYPARLALVCAECLRSGSGEGTPAAVALGAHGRHVRRLVAVCANHRDMVAQGESLPLFDPEEVRGLLLGRYAVDPMPFDAVRMLFERPRPAAPARQWPTAVAAPAPHPPTTTPTPTPAHVPPVSAPPVAAATAKDPLWLRIAMGAWEVVSFCIGLAFVAILSIASLQSCIVTVDAAGGAPIPSAAPLAATTDASRPASESTRWVRPDPLPRLEFVCGRPHGGWIELVACSPGVPLTGSAFSPADDSCIGKPEAITMRPGYSICWESFGAPVAVDPHAVATNPFAR
jgi:hypothetical protein